MSIEEKNKFFHLCDVDFLFRLLKQQVTSFSKFNEFLKKSEKIWKEEENYDIIEKKIINLVRAENGL